jgi:hypothetical protein
MKMEIIEGLKELFNLTNKLNNIEIQKKLAEINIQALEMQNEIVQLKSENNKLKEKQNISDKIVRHKDAYITLKDDEQQLIYCSNCYDSENKLVQGQVDEDGHYSCPACKFYGYYNKERYDNISKNITNEYESFIKYNPLI